MFGFIVTTHHNNYNIIKKCLDLLFDNIPINSFVILYVNETKCNKVLNIKNIINEEYSNNNFDVIFIEDQIKNNGLTGTWNQGINYLFNKSDFDCKVITILGHDSFINKDIKYLLDAALESNNNNKELKYFGPLCKSDKYTGINLWQDSKFHLKHKLEYLTGFLMTFPINSLIKNRINKDYYFNEKRFPFAGNEVEWFERFKKIKGEAVLIKECIIDHEHNRSWLNIQNDNDEIYNKIYLANKIDQLEFDWKTYLIKNPDLKKQGIYNQVTALNHYITIGKNQKRKY
jgi:hypothetical protein